MTEEGAKFKPAEMRFALIDFDAAAIFPMNTDIDKALVQREMRLETVRFGLGEGLANPFQDDVVILVFVIQRYIRVRSLVWTLPSASMMTEFWGT